MGKDKSILEKIAGTMKDIANIAADAADHAMKANEAPPKAVERSAAYIPLAADGLVSDPMMVPPIAAVHAPRRKRAPLKRAAKAGGRLQQRRLSKNPPRSRQELQPGGPEAQPRHPRGNPARKPTARRARAIAEREPL